ncbi:MAG: hypothetical protein GY710_08375 [Desulfobacteraceae bacterium]|nr:hypothetical protein [Desulfobacteraceae bacterium]
MIHDRPEVVCLPNQIFSFGQQGLGYHTQHGDRVELFLALWAVDRMLMVDRSEIEGNP